MESETNRNILNRGSQLGATLNCNGIEVNERRHTSRAKCNPKGNDSKAYVKRPSDNDADERYISSISETIKTVATPDNEKARSSKLSDRFSKTRAMSTAYARQYYYHISDYVQAEKKLMIRRKTPHQSKVHKDRSGKRNNPLPSEIVNHENTILKEVHGSDTLNKTRKQENVSQEALRKGKNISAEQNQQASKTQPENYTADNAVNINKLPHNKHLKDTYSHAYSGLKQPECREEVLLSDSKELSVRGESPSKDVAQSLTPQDTFNRPGKQRDRSLKRSASVPPDCAFPYKWKLSAESHDSGKTQEEENQNPIAKMALVAPDVKHQRKQKHPTVWLHQPAESKHNFNQLLMHYDTVDRMAPRQSLPSKDGINEQMNAQLYLKPGCEKDVSNDNSRSEMQTRPQINIAETELANETLHTAHFHPMSHSKALSEDVYKPTDKETSSFPNDNLFAETRQESRPENDKYCDISGPVMDGEYDNSKIVKTAVARPMFKEERECKRIVQRSVSFSYPHNKMQLKRVGFEGPTNASVFSHDSRLTRKLHRATSDSHGRPDISRKRSIEIHMPAVLNSNILHSTYPDGLKSLIQCTNKSSTDGTIKFHSERKPSFKFNNIPDNNDEDAHISKAILFSRGMNDGIDTQDLNDVIDNESMTPATDTFVPEVPKTVNNDSPYRSSSCLIQSTADKSRSVQRLKSERHVPTNNSKF